MENLTGGAENDLFVASSGTSLAGTMSGVAGNDQFTITPDAGVSFQVAGGIHSTLIGDVLTVTDQTQLPVNDGTTVTTLELGTVDYTGIETFNLQCATCAVAASFGLLHASLNSPLVDNAFADPDSSLVDADAEMTDVDISSDWKTSRQIDDLFATFSAASLDENSELFDDNGQEEDQVFSLPPVSVKRRTIPGTIQGDRRNKENDNASLLRPTVTQRDLRNPLQDLVSRTSVRQSFILNDPLHGSADVRETVQDDSDDDQGNNSRKPKAIKKVLALLNSFFSLGL